MAWFEAIRHSTTACSSAHEGREYFNRLDNCQELCALTGLATQEVTGQALQIHGAAGYGRGLPVERMARDARMFAIGGGTVEVMRNLIADRLLPSRADFRP